MTMLQIEGLPIPVLVESLSIGGEMVGNATRNQRGHRLLDRRRQKLTLDFTIAPKPLPWAMLYRALVLGEGEFFDTQSIYGSKGYQLSGSGSINLSGSGHNPVLTNPCWDLGAGLSLVVPGEFYNQSAVASGAKTGAFGATMIAWRYDTANSEFRAVGFAWRRFDTTATVKREALAGGLGINELGTPQAFTGNESFSVNASTGALTVLSMDFDPLQYSQIRVIPWYLQAAQIDALLTARNLITTTFPKLPKVYVETDMLPNGNAFAPATLGNSVLVCHGEVDTMAVQPTMQNTGFDPTTTGMSARLIEV